MSKRAAFPVVLLALALAAGGCGGTTAPADASHPSGRPAAPRYGEPAVGSPAAADAVAAGYQRLNLAIIRKNKAHVQAAAFSPVDTGVIRESNAFDLAAERHGYREPDDGWRFGPRFRLYAPPSRTWPKEFVYVSHTEVIRPRTKQKDDPRWMTLSVFRQAKQGGPWKQASSVGGYRAQLPQPLAAGADPTIPPALRRRALQVVHQLPGYWSTGTVPAGLRPGKVLDGPIKDRESTMRQGGYASYTYTSTVAPGPGTVHLFPVTGGVLVLADYHQKVHQAMQPRWTFTFNDAAAAVWGAQPRTSFDSTRVATAAFFVPTSGPVRGLGYNSRFALY